MPCLVCERSPGDNRAVVRVSDGERIGGLCGECERAVFGEVLAVYGGADDDCVVCGATGAYRLPSSAGNGRGDGPARLCTAHFQGLRSAEPD